MFASSSLLFETKRKKKINKIKESASAQRKHSGKKNAGSPVILHLKQGLSSHDEVP